MALFTKAFWLATFEHAVVAAAAAFGASMIATSGNVTLTNLATAGIAAGIAALYSLVKAIGGVQTVNRLAAEKAPTTR